MVSQSQSHENIALLPLGAEHMSALLSLGDEVFGAGYMEAIDLKQDWKSLTHMNCTSFVAVSQAQKLLGVRLTYPAGQWPHLDAYKKADHSVWPHPKHLIAYFKLAMVAPAARGLGVARRLANESIANLKAQGAHAVITHSWNESPDQSSLKYLESLGFLELKKIGHFWEQYDYHCIECHSSPCVCTATEMVLDFYD